LWLVLFPAVPTVKSVDELTCPASNKTPAIETPPTSATFIHSLPFVGFNVAYPSPKTIVSSFLISIGASNE